MQWQIPPSTLLDSAYIRTANIQNVSSLCMKTNHITILNDPINGTDGVNKEYLNKKNLWKTPVLVATTGNVTLSGLPDTIDDYPVTTDSRVLVRLQINEIHNGIYIIKPDAWVRAEDVYDGQHASGVSVWVLEGTQYGNIAFICDDLPGSDVVGLNPLVFVPFLSDNVIVPGNALRLNGNTLNVNVNSTDVSVNTSNQLQLTTTGVVPGSYGSVSHIPTFSVDSKGRLTQASQIYTLGAIRVLNYTQVNSLPHNITAAELLGGYILVSGNISGNLILPSASSIVAELGYYVFNMSFTYVVAKNGNSNMMVVLDPSITNPLGIDLEVKNRDIDYIALVLTSSTTGIILPIGVEHKF